MQILEINLASLLSTSKNIQKSSWDIAQYLRWIVYS